jgi:hypothetical protein
MTRTYLKIAALRLSLCSARACEALAACKAPAVKRRRLDLPPMDQLTRPILAQWPSHDSQPRPGALN